jgi:hypothetical protein
MTWLDHVREDPLPWLLDEDTPAVRAQALQRLCGRRPDDPEVVASRAAAMLADPIRAILAAQDPAGWWSKPGPGYGPKYLGTVWQLVFLDQLGADGHHPQVALACDYVLRLCPTTSGGFGSSAAQREVAPPASTVVHCLNGNLLRALIGFDRLDDPAVQAAVEWAARSILGEDVDRWYASGTSGPLFACAANEHRSCAWGAVKELGALARVPVERRSARVRRAVDAGVQFLLSHDPAVADYPMGWGNTKPNASWFKLGFPSGYVTDVLQNVEVLAELGHAADECLTAALNWVESQQGSDGRWRNRYAYNGKTWTDIEQQGKPSKWVTLRACSVLEAAYGSAPAATPRA